VTICHKIDVLIESSKVVIGLRPRAISALTLFAKRGIPRHVLSQVAKAAADGSKRLLLREKLRRARDRNLWPDGAIIRIDFA
jgi:hypothetical protein